MNRIEQIFNDLKSRRQKALMPFITAGDPDLETTAALLPEIERSGAHIVELGIPFSDPIADGPVIQESMTYALSRGLQVSAVFDMVRRLRPQLEIGVVMMVSYSIVYRLGLEAFLDEAVDAGVDGMIFPDLSYEESGPVAREVRDRGLIMSMLIAPGTSNDRAGGIAGRSSGFIYLLSRAGITGEQTALPEALPQRVSAIRQATALPIAVGFGISNPDQVSRVVSVADAAIVGSAIIRRIVQYRHEPQRIIAGHVGSFVRQLATGLSPATARECS